MGRPRRNLKSSSPIVKAEDEDDDDYELISASSAGEVKTEEVDSDSDYDFERDVSSSKKNLKETEKAKSKNGTGDAAARKTQRSTTTYSTTEEKRQRARESYRMKILSETPEEKEERNRKNRIVRQKRVEKLSSDEFKEYCRKEKERKRRSYDKITPERRAEMYEKMRKKRAEMTPEERKERANRIYECQKRYYKENPKSEERRRKENELQKQRNSIPERREKIRLYNRIRYHKVNNEMDTEALAAIRKHNNFQGFIRRLNRTEEDKKNDRMKKIIYKTTRLASMTDEELKAMRKRNREKALENEKRMSAEQKERNRINQKKAISAYMKRNAAKVNAYNREYQKRQRQNETPAKRHHRLLGYRISQARRKLKKQLDSDGMSLDEIQKRLDELTERFRRENPPPQESSTTDPGPMSTLKPRRGRPKKAGQQQVQLVDYVNNDTISSNDYDNFNAPVSSSPTPLESSAATATEQENVEIAPSDPFLTRPTIPYYGKVEPNSDAIHSSSSSSNKNKEENDSQTSVPQIPNENAPLNQLANKPITSKTEPIPTTRTSRFDLNKTWNCPKCQAIVHSHLDLNQHYKTYHFMPNKLKKEKVLEKESSEEKVEVEPKEMHTFSSEKIEIKIPHKFVCMKCPVASPASSFETKKNLLAHVKRKHRKSFWPCAHCGILKYSSSSHESHFNICVKVNKNLTEVKTDKIKSVNRSKSKIALKKRSYRKRK